MYSQNILKYYGSKLDIKLDSSELYDYEIAKTENDYDEDVLDLTTEITYSSLVIDSGCLTSGLNSNKPWVIEIDFHYTGETCDFTVRKRTEKGWTLDFVFNRENNPWSDGSVFYFWGISGETEPSNYLDNNLSFSFTSDARIIWKSLHYSGYCGESGYTGTTITYSGQTPVLCSGGTSEDFNVTITFERYRTLDDCDLLNMGGSNDLVTGWTVTNVLDVVTGDTEDYTIIEKLNDKWFNERKYRLGVLKIYLNGFPIYKLNDWEEIIPSQRESTNPLVQVWGGGSDGYDNFHYGITGFNFKKIKYFEEPLNFLNIRHHYLVSTKPFYNFTNCTDECVDDDLLPYINAILTEDGDYLTTEDGYILIF